MYYLLKIGSEQYQMKSEATRCDGKWTEAKFRSFVKSQLRKGSMKWPPKNEVLKKARLDRGVYLCNVCQLNIPASVKVGQKRVKNVYVDHVAPIVDPEFGFTSWDEFIHALYCDSTNLQVMCLDCHSKKTAEERRISTERARKQKESEKANEQI